MVLPQIGQPLIVGVLARLVAGLVPRQVERPDRPLVDVDPALDQHLGQLVVAVGQGEVEPGGAEVLHALDPVHGEAGVDLEEEAGDAGVDEGVADDEDVEEGLACKKCGIGLIYYLLRKKVGDQNVKPSAPRYCIFQQASWSSQRRSGSYLSILFFFPIETWKNLGKCSIISHRYFLYFLNGQVCRLRLTHKLNFYKNAMKLFKI